jgi:nitrile hydratase
MSRPNDVGGLASTSPIEREADEPPFHAEWEARVFGLNRVLMQHGVYNLDQFRDAVERIEPERYRTLPYYEKWLTAIEMLVRERGLVP